MSVGLDFGNQTCLIAITKRGAIEVIANEASNRLTPSLVGFGVKQRFAGEPALTQYVTNVKNTISQIKRFLGKNYDEIKNEIPRVPFRVTELPNKEIGIEVDYNGESMILTPTRIAAMLLYRLKETAEENLGAKVNEAVISCPVYYTIPQRKALEDAAEIAGLKSLRIFNETAAIALYYGFYKLDLPEKDPINVMFIDCGHSATSVSIVAFTKGKLKIVATTFDANLGGRDIDELLVNFYAEEFKKKYKIDILTNPRALLRTRVSIEKLKQILSSGVGEAPLNIESLMEDKDVSERLNRKDFEETISPLVQRMVGIAARALEEAKITPNDLASVEITGGGKRIPAVQRAFQEFLKRDLHHTLNDVEAVSRGCALQCAMLSSFVKVRDFQIADYQAYPIKLRWRPLTDGDRMEIDSEEDAKNQVEIFPAGSSFPVLKQITLKQSGPFEIIAFYGDSPHLPPVFNRQIARYTIPNLPNPNNEKVSIRIKVKLNIHGTLSLESVEIIETIETDEPATPTTGTPTQAPVDGEKESEAPGSPADSSNAQQPSAKKKKIRHIDLQFNAHSNNLNKAGIANAIEEEGKMRVQDRLAIETAEAKNAVESYTLDMRKRIVDDKDLAPFATEQEKEDFSRVSYEVEDWLYEDGDDTTKSAYNQKLAELKKYGDPVVNRKNEDFARSQNSALVRDSIRHYREELKNPKYDHIDPQEKAKIAAECDKIEQAVNDLLNKQQSLPRNSNPSFKASELLDKKRDLEKLANPILSKPKPAPPPAPKPEPTAAPTNNTNTNSSDPNAQQNQDQNQAPPTPASDVDMSDAPN
eukprot:TRINITY_DN1875_c0_g1_i1.p1 TRINITY_DN1875_c0_g1~~TRINITY_DN1875_c0_g1_i1.p1  ORF type:complete len:826 (+),score=224.88 TRINITY_DN1875_c0_g1_i1:37-2478(+)